MSRSRDDGNLFLLLVYATFRVSRVFVVGASAAPTAGMRAVGVVVLRLGA